MSRKIKTLVVGSGGREDALIKLIGQSKKVERVYAAPGNAGMLGRPKLTLLPEMGQDINALAKFAMDQEIGLTIVGPEALLAAGIVDRFKKNGLPIFGPNQAAARIESSKIWAKTLMKECDVPTADFWITSDPENAKKYAKANLPCVIKADGLAAGKGVDICHTSAEVDAAIERMMVKKELGDVGGEVIVEELLKGYELSFMVLTDGSNILPLLPTMDHKQAFNGDKGPNTGGMGAVAPVPMMTEQLKRVILEKIICPILDGMRSNSAPFKGCLYAGLMITRDGPKVLEFNCRFGDPELQPLAMLIESDIVPVFQAIAWGGLNGGTLKMSDDAAVCVVMASGGYPGKYQPGKEITGLEKVLAGSSDSDVFFSGVKSSDGKLLTGGGRVLGVTARAKDIPLAIKEAYRLVSEIKWEGEHHRNDIGWRILANGIQLSMKG